MICKGALAMKAHEAIKEFEMMQVRMNVPDFRVGDRLKIYLKVREGDKERLQPFEGDVIRFKNAAARTTFTMRKISYGVGVERVFPLYSPLLAKIEVLKRGKVRQGRLYYLRELRGKAARIKERDRRY